MTDGLKFTFEGKNVKIFLPPSPQFYISMLDIIPYSKYVSTPLLTVITIL